MRPRQGWARRPPGERLHLAGTAAPGSRSGLPGLVAQAWRRPDTSREPACPLLDSSFAFDIKPHTLVAGDVLTPPKARHRTDDLARAQGILDAYPAPSTGFDSGTPLSRSYHGIKALKSVRYKNSGDALKEEQALSLPSHRGTEPVTQEFLGSILSVD